MCVACEKAKTDSAATCVIEGVVLQRSTIRSAIEVHGECPNFMWFGTDRVILGHIYKDDGDAFEESMDEVRKLWNQAHAVKKLLGDKVHVFFLRLNLNDRDSGDATQEERIAAYTQCIQQLIDADLSDYDASLPHVKYLFYPSTFTPPLDIGRTRSSSIRVLV